MSSPTDRPVFNDRYEIHSRIGRGGMADVFSARDLLLDRQVAIKVLFPEFATDANFVERFRREAFLAGYTDGRGLGADDAGLLAAYEADKAVYEVVYEVRNRPDWVGIPLGAVATLAATPPDRAGLDSEATPDPRNHDASNPEELA